MQPIKKSKFAHLFAKTPVSWAFPGLSHFLKWTLVSAAIGLASGSASALFLVMLNWAGNWRDSNLWVIWFLPFGGLLIGLSYHYLGKGVEKGNNQILEEIENPKKSIPFIMTPLVLLTTVATHLFGGSAGREGTAVQMGGAISDLFARWLTLSPTDRRILLIIGLSGGFASVFGTPLAGAVFGLEVYLIGTLRYDALLPAFLTAIIADYTTSVLFGVPHSHYAVLEVPGINPMNIIYSMLAGGAFGLAARAFSLAHHYFQEIFRYIKYPPLRPLAGGAVLAATFFLMGSTRYAGLGLPVIAEAFEGQVPVYDFALKLAFTAFTLAAGFKGGEVTPLFFIGATLGNALSFIMPLPTALLASMGFVAVLSGAANTPLATTLVAIELFGASTGVFAAIACITSFWFSGHSGIYSSQMFSIHKNHKQ